VSRAPLYVKSSSGECSRSCQPSSPVVDSPQRSRAPPLVPTLGPLPCHPSGEMYRPRPLSPEVGRGLLPPLPPLPPLPSLPPLPPMPPLPPLTPLPPLGPLGSIGSSAPLPPYRRDMPPDLPGRRWSPTRLGEAEQSLRVSVGNDWYRGPQLEPRNVQKDVFSDLDRRNASIGPNPDRYERSLGDEEPPIPYVMRYGDDLLDRDLYKPPPSYSPPLSSLQSDRKIEGRMNESLRPLDRDLKRPHYEEDLYASVAPKYRRSRSPSPYSRQVTVGHESSQRMQVLVNQSSNPPRDIPVSANPPQSANVVYPLQQPEGPSPMPRSILKKRVEQAPEPALSNQHKTIVSSPASLTPAPGPAPAPSPASTPIPPTSSPQASNNSFSSQVETLLKIFNKAANSDTTRKQTEDGLYDHSPFSTDGIKDQREPGAKEQGTSLSADFLLPHEKASKDGSGFPNILDMATDHSRVPQSKQQILDSIEDEEKFLYGDDDGKPSPSLGKKDLPSHLDESANKPPALQGSDAPVEKSDNEISAIHDLLKTIGLDMDVGEVGQLTARTQERLYGKKPVSHSPERRISDPKKPDSWELRRSRSDTQSPESPVIASQASDKDLQQTSKAQVKDATVGQDTLISNRAPNTVVTQTITAPIPAPRDTTKGQKPVNSEPAPPTVQQHGQNTTPGWQKAKSSQISTRTQSISHISPKQPSNKGAQYSQRHSNLISVTTTIESNDNSNLKVTPIPEPPQPLRKDGDAQNPTDMQQLKPDVKEPSTTGQEPQTDKVIEEIEKIKTEQDLRQKRLRYLGIELERMKKQRAEMLRKKPHDKDTNTDAVLNEVTRMQDSIKVEMVEICQEAADARTKLYELETVAMILGVAIKANSQNSSTETKEDSAEKNSKPVASGQESSKPVTAARTAKHVALAGKDTKGVASVEKNNTSLVMTQRNSIDKSNSPVISNEKNRIEVVSIGNSGVAEMETNLDNTVLQNKQKAPLQGAKTIADKRKSAEPSKSVASLANMYEFCDGGSHWCKDCNAICANLYDYFTHMHNRRHRQTLDPYKRPWANKGQVDAKQDATKTTNKISVPAKGSEFLMPVTGFYCELCEDFFGDQLCAEQHVKSYGHNESYKKYIEKNLLYEERRKLDRQVGLAAVKEADRRRANELKRKLQEQPKEASEEKDSKVPKKGDEHSAKDKITNKDESANQNL
ncbi:hypothetical protein NDU88_001327, partial [Pleurodeles waltl]